VICRGAERYSQSLRYVNYVHPHIVNRDNQLTVTKAGKGKHLCHITQRRLH
jgi:hypothetical protein